MRLLAIETSCDETAVCLLEASGDVGADFSYRVLGNALFSQAHLHAQYGGVYPNLAKREHAKNLVPLLEEALRQADSLNNRSVAIPLEGPPLGSLQEVLVREPELLERIIPFIETYKKPDIDAIAVTNGPGLEPALWVGINFAKALSHIWNVPLVPVNHMEGHVMMSMVENGSMRDFEFPVLSLLISGGHTELILSRQWMHYERIGETRDDAAGEAFDKVARLMDLPYPGGPVVSKLAAEARAAGMEPMKFTPPMLNSKDYDFSFSGLKTEVRKVVEASQPLTTEMQKAIALGFENAVAQVLVHKTIQAVDEFDVRTVVVGGGVSANSFIRSELAAKLASRDASAALLVPSPEFATDNALMIAIAGYFHALTSNGARPEDIIATGNLRLETSG